MCKDVDCGESVEEFLIRLQQVCLIVNHDKEHAECRMRK